MAGPVNGAPANFRNLAEQALEEALKRVRGNGSARASKTLATLLNELGAVQRADHEELELRVAQLEHRQKLLEDRADCACGTDSGTSN